MIRPLLNTAGVTESINIPAFLLNEADVAPAFAACDESFEEKGFALDLTRVQIPVTQNVLTTLPEVMSYDGLNIRGVDLAECFACAVISGVVEDIMDGCSCEWSGCGLRC